MSDAAPFLDCLFHPQPPGTVIAVGEVRKPHFVRTPRDALPYVEGKPDVFVRVTFLAGRPANGRGTAADSVAMPAVWVELDVNGGPTNNGAVVTGGARSVRHAMEVAHLVLEPTLLVLSGHGVHAYWVLEDPWLLGDELERQAAGGLVAGWQERLRRESGIEIDATHDLARILRVPGSTNGKGAEPAPVVLASDGGPRYAVEELAERAVRRERSRPRAAEPTGEGRPVEVLWSRFPKLSKLARREGRPPGDGTGHAWDYALACEARRTVPDLTETEAVELLAYARRLHPDAQGKGEREGYLTMTVGKAWDAVGRNVPVTAATRPAGVDDALAEMSEAVGIAELGVTFTAVRVSGAAGTRGAVDMALSNGEELYFASIRELASASGKLLADELTYAVRGGVSLNAAAVQRVLALLPIAATRTQSAIEDEAAREWGTGYLDGAEGIAADMADRRLRWRAFGHLAAIEQASTGRDPVPRAVLDDGGTRYVRSGWFCQFARKADPTAGSNAQIVEHMRRVGWQRRGASGYIKAADPDGVRPVILWAFLIVPAGWTKTLGAGDE